MSEEYLNKKIYVNGIPRTIIADAKAGLAEVIRQNLGLTGTKVGCNKGQCGACNIILNGKLVRSCITNWDRVPNNSVIVTIEGLGDANKLHPLQWAFAVTGAIQCGFCTPGFIMSAKALLDKNLEPTRQEVRTWFQKHRNACRCTGYKQIVDAVIDAAKVIRGELEMKEFSSLLGKKGEVWGTSYPRPSAVYKATGTWDFGEDFRNKLPDDTLYGAMVQSKLSHAVIKKIDLSRAEKMPGVYKVVTAKDVKGTNRITGQPTFCQDGFDRPIFCDEKIFMYGDVVALVCADTQKHADAAAKAVILELEELPAYMSAMDAIAEDSIQIHPGTPNLYNEKRIAKGEETAPLMEKSAHVVEGDYYLQRQPHLVMEPDVGFGYIDEKGRLTIQSKSIWIYFHQAQMAPGLGLEAKNIRIIQNNSGGSFGYKLSITCEAIIGAAVLATGKPVFLAYNMAQTISYTPNRSPFDMHMKLGVDKNGKIIAMETKYYVDHGPYSEFSERLTQRGTQFMGANYAIPNIRGIGHTVCTNQTWGSAFRAFGAPQAYTATEILMDEMAKKIGIDPLEFRYMNVIREGDTFPFGQKPDVYVYPLMIETIRPKYQAALEKAEQESTETVKKGVGIALGVFGATHDGPDTADIIIELTQEGITLYNNWEDHGQGADIGALGTAHEALRELGLKPEQIKLVMNDTALAPNAGAASGSSSQVVKGNAILNGCEILLDAMKKEDGSFRTYDQMIAEKIPVRYTGTWTNTGGTMCDENCQGNPFGALMYGLFMPEVAVDITTGKVKVEKFTFVSDIGKINNIANVEGQMYGGLAQGIGLALSENFENIKKHSSLSGAGLPYIEDIPDDMELIHLAVPRKQGGPFGSSGVGELPLTAPHPAIINAIYNACGVRIRKLPALPEKILKKLKSM
ncbi:molybdopterin-dependent aldehyde oxidoreductase [Desulfobacula phenolica]|uniref:Aldehyde dehydrogenase, molybdenum-binding subunit apoprotein n=1 Tax=Desulfobacula phenolica TaxID=90732 RepID=A0A1H2IRR6_9BACT|nr:molybdopterin-dependent aldehyde oxidoreductase [Desulfobacula phenolica]SDU46860.1 aldehyde dehydrogenase, molybdenum-binding subunit apoprotein [Desulfobacula phenolica]